MEDNYYKKYEPIFGAWYIKRKLGAGSFGAVYEIEREDFGVTYKAALKTITIPADEAEIAAYRADGLSDEEISDELYQFTSELIAEFELMSKLKGNSNIVSYEDHQVIRHDDGIGWDILIRMELLTPLVEYIHNNPIRVSDVIKLGIDMCHALELCQKFNIIHRDIKPENIFISRSGDYKLGDFGIARQIEKTTFGLSKKGTYNYMAPEVYKGQKYGTGVDMYSLGIVLYRLLNQNRAPFMPPYPEKITHTNREQALIKRMSGEALPPPKSLSEGRLVEIIMKAAAYAPEDRYSSPVQMREDLTSIQYDYSEYVLFNPNGDKLEINSINYAETDTAEVQTEIMRTPGDESATEVMTSLQDKKAKNYTQNRGKEKDKKKKTIENRKKKITAAAITATAVCIAGAVMFGIKYFSSEEEPIVVKQEEASAQIALGETKSVKELVPEMSFYSNTQYTSDNEEIVKIDENGIIIPVSEGEARILCKSDTDADEKVDLEGSVNISVSISKEEQAAVEAAKQDLNGKYGAADAVLQKVIGDASISQDNVAYEKNAMIAYLAEFNDKIGAIKRSADTTAVINYYNDVITPAQQSLEKAYNIAYEIAHPPVKNTSSSSVSSSKSTSSSSGSKSSSSSSSSKNKSSSSGSKSSSSSSSSKSTSSSSGSKSSSSSSNSKSTSSSSGSKSSGSSSNSNSSGTTSSNGTSSGSSSSSASSNRDNIPQFYTDF